MLILAGIYIGWQIRAARRKPRPWEDEGGDEGLVIDRSNSSLFRDNEPADPELTELGRHMTISDDAVPVDTSAVPADEGPAPASLSMAAEPAGAPEAARPAEPAPPPEPQPQPRHTAAASVPATEEKIIVIYLQASPDAPFRGPDIVAAAQAADLEHGDMRIFHRLQPGGDPRPVFSMANIVEPGWFDLEAMDAFESPGLALFLQLPGPLEGPLALDAMLASAQIMQRQLGGELRDAQRSVLTKQTMAHLREDVQEFTRRQRLAQRRPH